MSNKDKKNQAQRAMLNPTGKKPAKLVPRLHAKKVTISDAPGPKPTSLESSPDAAAEWGIDARIAEAATTDNNSLASTDAVVVDSVPSNVAETLGTDNNKETTMTLTYKGLSKSGKFALYSGLRTVTRMSITDFPDGKPIPSFEVSGDFAGARVPKPKLTAEERKAARAAKPKPTLAELIEKREKALAALKAKAAAPAEATA